MCVQYQQLTQWRLLSTTHFLLGALLLLASSSGTYIPVDSLPAGVCTGVQLYWSILVLQTSYYVRWSTYTLVSMRLALYSTLL